MSSFIYLFAFLLFASNNYYVAGRLVDHEYNPIECFILKTHQSYENRGWGSLIRTDTIRNQNGEFMIDELKNGAYSLQIEVPNYTAYTLYVEVKNENYSFGDIFLQISR